MESAVTQSIFVGRYTDPNHPGGTREIQLVPGAMTGSYRLAEVKGGGGRGEPANFTLPAIIIEREPPKWGARVGTAQICIDFSVYPKNGPRDYIGTWDEKAGGIRFRGDNNLWPKQPICKL